MGLVHQPLVIALLGPTASGKTALGIKIAKALELAVLSVDSRQLYREMDIGTAKPTAEQRAEVRHELLDLRNPDQPINLQEFRQAAEQQIEAEHQRQGIALLVGGSGLYLKAINQGMTPPAVPPQAALRQQLEALGQPQCHALLREADPEAGGRIMPNDAVRTQRALEVLYATGRPLSAQQGSTPPPWRVLELGLNPPDLRQRIAQRSSQLFRDGLIEETRGLQERYGVDCPLLATIGYGEAAAVLRGDLNQQQALEHTTRRTQQFAKRQRTWFRRQHTPIWLEDADPLQQALSAIERVLG
ncbi:MAG: tRNA (adenosine(37)-N6)-dimethylallyltransferase MiaA [Cyanobacteria bacterium M_surface_10_m1_298]|nr:tRNA (adenosine(37)-N6)-dimethylallyltransferase MiaA [Cyanobacteria bacterium M_surface_10_m1_298]